MRALGRARDDQPTTTPNRCDACHTTNTALHTINPDGGPITICIHPKPCIARAQASGTWKP